MNLFRKMKIGESIIDFPRKDLPLEIWNKEGKTYLLKPEVKKKILNVFSKYKESEFENVFDSFKDIRIVGSLTSNQYTKYSDLDVHLVPINFDVWTPERRKKVSRFFRDKKFKIGTHPIEVYIQIEPQQDFLRGCYSLKKDTWLTLPNIVPLDYNPLEDYSDIAEDLIDSCKELDLYLGELKRDVIDYQTILSAIKRLPIKKRKNILIFLYQKLQEIYDDINKLRSIKRKWIERRKALTSGDLLKLAKRDLKIAQLRDETEIIFKYLNRYRYLKIISELENLLQRGLTSNEINKIGEINV